MGRQPIVCSQQEMTKRNIVLIVIFLLFAATIFAVSNTSILTHTEAFVEGQGNEMITNAIEKLNNGADMIVFEKNVNLDNREIADRIYDNPDLFWIDMNYKMVDLGRFTIMMFDSKYEDLDVKKDAIEDAADSIIDMLIDREDDEYTRVLKIHDWICDNVQYGAAADTSDQDIYGALIKKTTRCAGYAKLFTYLLERANIESEVISGVAVDETNERIPHAWNLVYIDDEAYYFDITWNDEDSYISYDWFGVTYGEFSKTHFPSNGYLWNKDATATAANYHIKNRQYIKEFSPSAIAHQINKQGLTFSFKCADRETMGYVEDCLMGNNRSALQKIMLETDISTIDSISYIKNDSVYCFRVTIHK